MFSSKKPWKPCTVLFLFLKNNVHWCDGVTSFRTGVTVVSFYVGAGNWTWVLWKKKTAHNHWAISSHMQFFINTKSWCNFVDLWSVYSGRWPDCSHSWFNLSVWKRSVCSFLGFFYAAHQSSIRSIKDAVSWRRKNGIYLVLSSLTKSHKGVPSFEAGLVTMFGVYDESPEVTEIHFYTHVCNYRQNLWVYLS